MPSRCSRPARRWRGLPLRSTAAHQNDARAMAPEQACRVTIETSASMGNSCGLCGLQASPRHGGGHRADRHRFALPEVTSRRTVLVARSPAGIVLRMHAPAHSGYHALSSPLAIAGYVAIAAVWYTAIDALAAIDPALAVPARVAVAAFAAGYLATFLPLPGSPYERLCVVVLGVATLGLLWLGPTGTSGVLLVLFAAVLASTVHGTGLVSTLLAVNAVFLGIMRWRWGADWDEAFSMLAAWGSFQMFATLLTHATTRAEAMSEALRASNADLLATRELLAASARDAERLHIARAGGEQQIGRAHV